MHHHHTRTEQAARSTSRAHRPLRLLLPLALASALGLASCADQPVSPEIDASFVVIGPGPEEGGGGGGGDTTPPETMITAAPAAETTSTTATFSFTGSDNWTAAANLTFQCSLDGSVFAACTSPQEYSGLTPGAYVFQVRARDAAGNVDPTPATHSWTVTSGVDTSPPVITPTIVGTLGNDGWYTSDVTVTWSVTDAESATTSQSGCGPTTITVDNNGTTLTCSATSAGGSASQGVTIKRDATPPTLNPSVSPNPVQVGGSATASANASDATSGIASASCGAVDASSAGAKTLTCTATDAAGNTATAQASYTVEAPPSVFTFTGFFAPVRNGVFNVVQAGRAVPIKFSLGGDQGLNIFASGYPHSQVIPCDGAAPEGPIEGTVNPVSSSLSYDPATQQYTYVWKTDRNWSTCRRLRLEFTDGTVHTADFRFTR